MSMKQAADLKQRFRTRYGRDARVFRAPGRVNLIGEHTDYNDGFVMPAAINFDTCVAVSARDDRKLVIRSENLDGQLEFDLHEASPQAANNWSDYVRGIAVVLERAGFPVRGADLLIFSEVP